MRKFDEPQLIDRLRPLPASGKVLFAASCARRLLPAYVAYSEKTGFGNYSKLKETLDRVWIWASSARNTGVFSEQELEETMELIPGEDAPWFDSRPYAEDAAAAVAFVVQTLIRNEAQSAAWAARRVYESLDHYVIDSRAIDINSRGAEQEVLGDVLIQSEFARQERDIEELTKVDLRYDIAFIERFKTRAENEPALPN